LLLRLIGEDGDLIPPGVFLYIAERFGLAPDLDRWVVHHAIDLLAEHQRAGSDLCLEVNVSAHSVIDNQLIDLITDRLAATNADPRGLCFELTETAAIINVDRARDFARRLSNLGCEFALDDFGAGFASFYYLKHLQFDYLKIDGEFIKDLPSSHTNQVIVKSVVQMAQGLGKKTIAEFVEDEPTLDSFATTASTTRRAITSPNPHRLSRSRSTRRLPASQHGRSPGSPEDPGSGRRGGGWLGRFCCQRARTPRSSSLRNSKKARDSASRCPAGVVGPRAWTRRGSW